MCVVFSPVYTDVSTQLHDGGENPPNPAYLQEKGRHTMRWIVALLLAVCMTGVSYAESARVEQLYDRLHRLQAENLRLREEIAHLRHQPRSCSPATSHGTRSSLSDVRRTVDEFNALKHSVDHLKR